MGGRKLAGLRNHLKAPACLKEGTVTVLWEEMDLGGERKSEVFKEP